MAPDTAAAAMPRITVLGSLNMDLVAYVPHHPLPGETLTSSHFATSAGGKGANQAVACAKLSRRASLADAEAAVAMVGAVGSDAHGAALVAGLAGFGVDVAAVAERPGADTGVALIIVDEPSGQNRIVLSPGANHALAPTDFAVLPAPRPDLLVMQLEIPLATVLQALAAARAAAVPVLLNPAPAQPLPDDAYRGLAHLVVNETEAAILSGAAAEDLDDLPGLQRVARVFVDRGVANVVVTLGGRGVYYRTAAGRDALVPACEAAVVDTTAAGDTFVGSYALAAVRAAAAARDFDIDAAVRNANRAAAITVSRKGAQVSIPWRDELGLD